MGTVINPAVDPTAGLITAPAVEDIFVCGAVCIFNVSREKNMSGNNNVQMLVADQIDEALVE